MTRRLAPFVVAALVSAACSQEHTPAAKPTPTSAPKGQAPGSAVSTPTPTDRTPRGPVDYPTTDGDLALGNLTSQIDGQEQVLVSRKEPEVKATIATQLLLRGQITGTLADYERAEKLMNELVKERPKSAVAWVLHARVMSTFHRFDEALADYARAEKMGEKTIELVDPRMGITAARGGKEDEVLAYREKMAKELPGIDTLGALAVSKGDLGDLKGASKLFGDAQDSYRNISPFPVAMLFFQNGLMEQKIGSPSRARALFQAAHDRLPAYAQATSHLASVLAATGEKDRAIELLRPLAEHSDDPEYAGELSTLLAAAGKNDEAAALHKRAAERYDALLKKYPLAFSDHAARFWLAPNGDPKRALSLAQANLANRATVDAQQLVIEAALAAKDLPLACKTADTMLARPKLGPYARVVASRAYIACGQKDRGERELATATSETR